MWFCNINIINITMIHDILKTRFTARSFADIPVDAGHLTQAIEVLKIVPSKQNVHPYSVNIFGYEHSKVKEELFKLTSCGEPIPEIYNPQVLAPLLLVWSYRSNHNASEDVNQFGNGHNYIEQLHNSMIEVGMSAMAVMTKFHELGYVSGFCKCFEIEKIKEVLSISHDVILILGVGYPSTTPRIGRTRPTIRYRKKPNFDTWITVR